MKNVSRIMVFAGLFFVLLCLNGCGNRYHLAKAKIEVDVQEPGTVVIAVQDARPYIISGEKTSGYLGRRFNGIGIPKDVFTRTGRAVSTGLANTVATSLKDNGYIVRVVDIPPNEQFTAANERLANFPYDRLILFSVKQLRIESFLEVELQWDFESKIYDFRNNLLAIERNSNNQGGVPHDKLKLVTSGKAQNILLQQVGEALFVMMNSEASIAALNIHEPNPDLVAGQGIALVEQSEDQDMIDLLERQLSNNQYEEFRNTSKKMYRMRIKDQQYLDQIAEIIVAEKYSENGLVVDGLAYLCKTIRSSRDARYKTIFLEIREDAKSKKLRKWAQATLNSQSTNSVLQFEPKG